MEKLNLKKVIWLAPEEPVRELYVKVVFAVDLRGLALINPISD